ncbi:hypothetical protein JOF53_001342 [Crossiella equi]|uniref:Ricin B lectin domain-containing protein n=1 Tax=Crossiella equi TaxID=130796 RepID=A0ABS5A791_9PSEU|nr:ricin-type beta-trefoil lectin domain protein [Crossiella equi]MBP2472470.1 hypothetical protein [Crossiella equi]
MTTTRRAGTIGRVAAVSVLAAVSMAGGALGAQAEPTAAAAKVCVTQPGEVGHSILNFPCDGGAAQKWTIAPANPEGSAVRLRSGAVEDGCLGAPIAIQGVGLRSVPCGPDRTLFTLPQGTGAAKQIGLKDTNLCVASRNAGIAQVILKPCSAEDASQKWDVPAGAGAVSQG